VGSFVKVYIPDVSFLLSASLRKIGECLESYRFELLNLLLELIDSQPKI
jgi:hypothetical protein